MIFSKLSIRAPSCVRSILVSLRSVSNDLEMAQLSLPFVNIELELVLLTEFDLLTIGWNWPTLLRGRSLESRSSSPREAKDLVEVRG